MRRLYIGCSLVLLALPPVVVLLAWYHEENGDPTFWLAPLFFWAIGMWIVLPILFIRQLEPRRAGVESMGLLPYRFALVMTLLMTIAPLGLVYVHWTREFVFRRALMIGLAFFVLFHANHLGKLRPNHFLGIRTPWTLNDPANWYATHRFASRTLTVAGLACLVLGILNAETQWLTVAVIGAGFTNYAYSYWYFRRHPRAAEEI